MLSLSLYSMCPILIQGAHPPEVDLLKEHMSSPVEVRVASFLFWEGELSLTSGAVVRVVLSVTGIGSALAAASTALAIHYFNPTAVINQGT